MQPLSRIWPETTFLLVAAALGPVARTAVAQAGLPSRWVFFHSYTFEKRQTLEKLKGILRTAKEHGLTGVVLEAGTEGWRTQYSGGFDNISGWSPVLLEHLKELRQCCDRLGIEIIPAMFQLGRAGALLARDPNLAEGLLVEGVRLRVHDGVARHIPDPDVQFVNGGLEEFKGDRAVGFSQEAPGVCTFADETVAKAGKRSLRMENFRGAPRQGLCRLTQEAKVKPRREYRVSVWVKTQDFEPWNAFGISVQGVRKGKYRWLFPRRKPLPKTSKGWVRRDFVINSLDFDRLLIAFSVTGARKGRLWLDEISLEEVAFVNLLRRDGCPVKIVNERTGEELVEGKDFAPLRDPNLLKQWTDWHEPPGLKLLPNARATEGEVLRASYYHPVLLGQSIAVCVSEPKVYEIWREQVRLVHRLLAPRRYFLMMDEIRQAGSCAGCKRRGLTLAQLLGDCITKQFHIIKSVNPDAEVYMWSDMLDPNHNANSANYYLCDGDIRGIVNFVPKEIVMVPWGFYEKSLKFFSARGFRTTAFIAVGDAGDRLRATRRVRKVVDLLLATPGACGLIYASWQSYYAGVAGFGDLVMEREGKRSDARTGR